MDLVTSSNNILHFRGRSSDSKQKLGLRKLPGLCKENGVCDKKSIAEYSIAKKPEAFSSCGGRVVDFSEVMDNFEQEHGSYRDDTNSISREYLNKADKEIVKKNDGGWLFVNLSYATAMKVLLPQHCHEDIALVSRCGDTAKDALKIYKRWSEQTKRNNPLCSGSLAYHLANPNKKPIFLTVEPIDEPYDYSRLLENPELTEGRLVHLDGLHRLVAMAINGNQESTISAYIACKEIPKKIDGLGFVNKSGVHRKLPMIYMAPRSQGIDRM